MTPETIPPYLASTLWLQGRVNHKQLKTRDFTRTLIDSNSSEGIVLTVPIVGGSSAVKRLMPEDLEVSAHGCWTRIHLGAIEAAYGREPYFQHLFPQIAEVVECCPQQLARLNVLLYEKMMEFLDYSATIGDVRKLRESNPERCADITRRLEAKINTAHSYIESLMRFGRDAIFLL